MAKKVAKKPAAKKKAKKSARKVLAPVIIPYPTVKCARTPYLNAVAKALDEIIPYPYCND